MKSFGTATLIALSALINGSSALWCACYQNGGGFLGADIWSEFFSNGCCEFYTGHGPEGGHSFFGLTQKDWCDVKNEKVDQYKKCCAPGYGYCK